MMNKSEAYLIEDTHLRLGSKIHITDYVYAKRLFQKSFYASKFAYIIAKNIYDSFGRTFSNGNSDNQSVHKGAELVLVGYAYYSELLVSRIKSILIQLFADKKNKPQVNHIIIDNENEINLDFYFLRIFPKYCQNRGLLSESNHSTAKTYFSIITPISSTLTTPVKIENEFHRQLPDFCKHRCSERKDNKCQILLEDLNSENKLEEICSIANLNDLFDFHSIPFQTLVVAGNGGLDEYPDDDTETQRLSLGFWKKIVFKEPPDANLVRHIITQNKVKNNERRINQFNLYIKSQWENIFSCKKCFPKVILDESPLFYADKTLVTPDFIHSLPDVNPINEILRKEDKNRKPFFILTEKEKDIPKVKRKTSNPLIDYKRPVITMDCVKQGHFVGTNKHFYFYFDYLRFFDLNKERIKIWSKSVKKSILDNVDYPIITSNATIYENKVLNQFDKILLITPNKSTSGTFAYMINKYVFNERCNIISFNPHDENINDFKLFFKDWLKSEKPHRTIVYYVDNLITKGNTALKVHDIIKYVRKEDSSDDSVGLAGIFTMISRLEGFDLFNIARKFKISYGDSSFTGIFSFARINHPVIEAQIAKMDESNCYLCNDLSKYRMIAPSCNLDNIREYINNNNVSKRIIRRKHDEDLRLMPHNDKDLKKFLRLLVTHELYNSFCESVLKEYFLIDNSSLEGFLENFIPALSEISNIKINVDKSGLFYNEIKAIVLKTLAEKPFLIHRDIKKTVFRWILKDLQKELNNFIDEPSQDDNVKSYILRINYIRMLYKKAGQLNANFIIRAETLYLLFILSSREEEIYKKIRDYESKTNSDQYSKQLSNFRIFIVAAIKESLFNNEPKSINLENNIKYAYKKFKLLQKDDQNKISIEPPKRLFESILLENSGVIRQAYGSWDKYFGNNYINKDYTEINLDSFIDEIIKDINNIIDDTKIDNLRRFIFSSHANEDEYKFSKDNESKSFIYSLALYNMLNAFKVQKKSNAFNKIAGKPEEVINLFLTILCQIMGIDSNNGGAFLLLKYQNINQTEINDDDLFVFGKEGVITEKLTQYLSSQSNSFSKEVLRGLNFLPNLSNSNYYWTCISALKNNNKWILQSSEKNEFRYAESDFADSRTEVTDRLTRFYFFRICHWKNENYSDVKTEATPQAVLVFYDNLLEEDKQSAIEFDITRVRYALGLKNELSDFISHYFENDSFKAWVKSEEEKKEKERTLGMYLKRFDKNSHEASDLASELHDEIENDRRIFTLLLSYMVKSHADIGKYYQRYHLKKIILSKRPKQINHEYFSDFFFNALSQVKEKCSLHKVCFNDDLRKEISTTIPMQYLTSIVFECISNALKNQHQNYTKIFLSRTDCRGFLIIHTIGKKSAPDFCKKEFILHLNSDEPNVKYGIGLFVANKIVLECTQKIIEIDYDSTIPSFTIKIPLL